MSLLFSMSSQESERFTVYGIGHGYRAIDGKAGNLTTAFKECLLADDLLGRVLVSVCTSLVLYNS